ncbi:hypothetical protein ABIB57_000904 [Devosia sp. UYZn731]|uniref:hypothetical protein n=1 Tax=Devosia sp. UYZn731 TaxID=3156345 RepID=UPI00339A4FCA
MMGKPTFHAILAKNAGRDVPDQTIDPIKGPTSVKKAIVAMERSTLCPLVSELTGDDVAETGPDKIVPSMCPIPNNTKYLIRRGRMKI